MFARLYSIRTEAWSLMVALLVLSIASAVGRSTDFIPSRIFLYYVQPAMAIAVFGLAWYLAHNQQDRVRHRGDKAFLVGSVLAVWFVLYFLSGLITTYTQNSLITGPRSILVNVWVFGVVAFSIEYARHGMLLLVRRRDIVWFGVVIALILSLQQMNFGLIAQTHGVAAFIKLGVSDLVPAIMSSFLLTYLAITAGLPAMLVYRLGLVAAIILPPIVPKYDWYLQGVSLILLAASVYIAIDRSRQDRQATNHQRYKPHPKRAYDIMSVALMLFLVMFVTGFFTYKPAAIASNSMEPVFSRGSVVVIQKVHDPMDVHVGDIVQYTGKDEMITHRVTAIKAAEDGSGETVFMTKGDNNPSKDPTVTESQIVGIVRAEIPFIGYPTVWLKDASGPGVVRP